MLYQIKIINGEGIEINNYSVMIKTSNKEEKLQSDIFNLCESFNTIDQEITESDEYDYKTQNK